MIFIALKNTKPAPELLTTKGIDECEILCHEFNNGVVDFGFQYEVGKANTRFAAGVSNFGFTAEPRGNCINSGERL